MTDIRVAVNGYGVIGKRVADAVTAQPDMTLAGVADLATDWRSRTAVVNGIPVYASTAEAAGPMREAGIPIAGDLDDLLGQVDAVLDCTPKKIGAGNLDRYCADGVKANLHGGEPHEATGHSFVAQGNDGTAIGREAIRDVSCATTSTVRVMCALQDTALRA